MTYGQIYMLWRLGEMSDPEMRRRCAEDSGLLAYFEAQRRASRRGQIRAVA
jgi:hypothetical protein